MSNPRIDTVALRASAAQFTEEFCRRFEAERDLDHGSILSHAEASQEKLQELAGEEQALSDYLKEMRMMVDSAVDALLTRVHDTFDRLRQREEQRLASLQAHADNIASAGKLPAPAEVKKLRAAG